MTRTKKEFDCTVAFAVAGKKHIGCFQVGDGSIVLRQNGVCRTVFLPEKGEFANQTLFLRPGGEERMDFQYALLDAEENSGIAVTSDGPEHLMFRLADMTPGKIFDLFLDDLRKEELCRQDLKKKRIPYRTLAVVGCLVIGLLAETACLPEQRQTISRQRTEIRCLRSFRRPLNGKKAGPETGGKPENGPGKGVPHEK